MEITRGQWIIIILLTLSFIATAGFVAFGLAAVLSFGPAYLYLKSIRNAEETDREPWSALQTAFVWGAVSGVFYALILNGLGGSLVFLYSGNDADLTFVLTAIIVAPIVEEFVKPLVLFRNASVKGEIDEVEDGIVYGAACGLGFGATENILYGLSEGAVSSGLLGVIIIVTPYSSLSPLLSPQQATDPLSKRAQALPPPASMATTDRLSGIDAVKIGVPEFAATPLPSV